MAAAAAAIILLLFVTTAFAFASKETISKDVKIEDDDWKQQLDCVHSVIDPKDVNARQHLRHGRANPSKEGRLSGKKLLQEYPNYVNTIHTATTTLLVCSDLRCNGIPTVVEGISVDEGTIPGIADPLKPIVTVGDTVVPGDGTFDNCPNRDGCSCTNEGDPYDYDTMKGYYCKWTRVTTNAEDADDDDDKTEVGDEKTELGDDDVSKV